MLPTLIATYELRLLVDKAILELILIAISTNGIKTHKEALGRTNIFEIWGWYRNEVEADPVLIGELYNLQGLYEWYYKHNTIKLWRYVLLNYVRDYKRSDFWDWYGKIKLPKSFAILKS